MIVAFLISIVFIILIVCIAVAFKSDKFMSKGERGENEVARILGETIIGEQYVINDILFECSSGKSCQIDHILINKNGIWVIETKNYAGKIYGEENYREWTQVLGFGNEVNKFYNPVKQNATHIYHLSKYLKVKNIFQNIVVFLDRADISEILIENVYSSYDLFEIKYKETGVCLSVEEMEHYYKMLLELKNNSTISKEQHVENIHRQQNQIQQGICPRCGGELVLRTGKNGQFYGCSNFPRCKFTKNID